VLLGFYSGGGERDGVADYLHQLSAARSASSLSAGVFSGNQQA